MARTSGQRSWPLEKSATLQDGFACQGDLILLACPQRQLFTIMERVILDRDGFCEMQVSVTTAAVPVTAAKQVLTGFAVLQSDRGKQAGVCQPGGTASHDNSHQAPD